MNIDMIGRTIRRHRLMDDRGAYEVLLQEARNSGDTWMVPQAEIAQWWEARQNAGIELRLEAGRLHLSCDLADAAIQIAGGAPVALPTVVDLAGNSDPNPPTFDRSIPRTDFWLEVLRHLGYGHVKPAPDGTEPTLRCAEVEALLDELHAHALQHQRFEPDVLARVREAIVQAHRSVGLPDLRLWPWPVHDRKPYQAALSIRYDVDKAIVTMPWIHELEDRYGLRSTAYLRPMGLFYGAKEIRHYRKLSGNHELALHGEFITTAQQRFGDEAAAARGEKKALEEVIGSEVFGVCMHGGELRTNTSPRTRDAVEDAGYTYETMYRNRYYFPLYLPHGDGVRKTLSIGQHFADISVPLEEGFGSVFQAKILEHLAAARDANGVFVLVMHPLYFGVGRYLSHPINVWRIAKFVPYFLVNTARMRRGQNYRNV